MKDNKAITNRDVDFAKWYNDVVRAARLATYSNVKGCIIFEPNGYAIWERMQSVLDKMFKETGHQNVYLPVLIPENLMKKEGELIKGFAPEVAWVTSGGESKLEERLCIRPTSETLFSDYYSGIIESYRDLPKLYNQWANVMRWEKTTRPFLRSREFLWQEGHTIHATKEEAEEETLRMLKTYETFFREYLAIPIITGKKTKRETFAGAEYTLTVEALMYNGVCLQSGTSHYFGQKFSRAYDIKFTDQNGQLDYAYQTSFGVSTRMIGALIMVHSDNNGLVLPPFIAPRQVAIIPIGNDDSVNIKVNEIYNQLNTSGISVYVDNSNKSVGYKFAEAEVNGIPVRIEIGKRDVEQEKLTVARRDTREKMVIDMDIDIITYVKELMNSIQSNLYNRALERRDNMTYEAHNLDEFESVMNRQPGFVKAMWCGSDECELKLKEIKGTKSRCIVENQAHISDKCVVCGNEAKELVIWGIQY